MKIRRRRRRLTRQQREAKLKEWERRARQLQLGPIKVPWQEIPDLDAETIALEPSAFAQAVKTLTNQGAKFWHLGPLDCLCGRLEHNIED